MKFKLNRYLIAGFVLSVMWIIGAGLYAHSGDVNNANDFASFAAKVCSDGVKLGTSTPEKCEQERTDNVASFMQGDTGNVLILAFVPLPLLWLVAFCLFHFVRAQWIGFGAVIRWRSLSWQKRAFVVLCFVFVAGSAAFGLLVLMNNYVDAEIPVTPTLKSFSKVPDGYVSIVGTWTRTDLRDDTIADPIQTSRIMCIKSELRCTEAKASISGNSLFADQFDYIVQSWTDSAIVLRNDYPCATEVYTIDLNTEVVSGAGSKTNKGKPYCDTYFNRDNPDHWTMMMEDGLKVYWAERQKKRPWLLRVMQTVLGN